MKVVVTGGAGFIGANLCRALMSTGGITVTAFDNLSTGFRTNLDGAPQIGLIEADILDTAALTRALTGTDCVVHLAARASVPRSIADPLASHEANATGTLFVLEAARACDVAQVIVASSSSVYGANRELPKSERMKAAPMSPYAASKLATESYTLAWQHAYGLRTLAFRFFNVFGPLQAAGHAYAAVVPSFVSAALRGDPLPIHGDGLQTRDFTYVGTVVAVLLDAILRRLSYSDPINLAFGSRSSLLDLAGALETLLGHPLRRIHGPVRPGDVRDSQADNATLQALFPEIRPVSLMDGLRSTVAWMQSAAPITE